MVKILFLQANPKDAVPVGSGVELSQMRKVFRENGATKRFEIEHESATTPQELQRLLLSEADIVHFSGHGLKATDASASRPASLTAGRCRDLTGPKGGGPDGALVLQNQDGRAVTVTGEALTRLIEIVQRTSSRRCVLLNACFTLDQAKAIAQHVDCVIGMKGPIDDRAAIAFTAGFYRGIALGKSVKVAVDLGRNQIQIEKLPDKDVPKLVHRPGQIPDKIVFGESWFARLLQFITRVRLRRAALALGAMLLCAIALVLLMPPVWMPAFQPHSGAIVVAGPRLGASEPGQPLCQALDADVTDGEPSVACLDLWPIPVSEETLRHKAIQAGASLLVLVDDQNQVTLRPLGRLAEHEVYSHGLPVIALSASQPNVTKQLAPILRSIAEMAEGALRLRRLRCTQVGPNDPPSLAFLSVITGRFRNCDVSNVTSKMLLRDCEGRVASDPVCASSRRLCTQVFPPAECGFTEQDEPMFKLAKKACLEDNLGEAQRMMTEFLHESNVCKRLPAAILATCIVQMKTFNEADKMQGYTDIVKLADAEGDGRCDDKGLLGSVLGERAWFRARGQKWADAASDYRKAWDLTGDQLYRVNAVEVLLRDRKFDEARDELEAIDKGPIEGVLRVQRALLDWILQRESNPTGVARARDRLIEAYKVHAPEGRIYDEACDPVLRPLACPDSGSECPPPADARPCVLDNLADGKNVDAFERVLKP